MPPIVGCDGLNPVGLARVLEIAREPTVEAMRAVVDDDAQGQKAVSPNCQDAAGRNILVNPDGPSCMHSLTKNKSLICRRVIFSSKGVPQLMSGPIIVLVREKAGEWPPYHIAFATVCSLP